LRNRYCARIWEKACSKWKKLPEDQRREKKVFRMGRTGLTIGDQNSKGKGTINNNIGVLDSSTGTEGKRKKWTVKENGSLRTTGTTGIISPQYRYSK